MAIQRYGIDAHPMLGRLIYTSSDGEWMRFADHEREIADLERIIRVLRDEVTELKRVIDVERTARVEAERKVEALTAFHESAAYGAEAFLAQTAYSDSVPHSSPEIARLMEDYSSLRNAAMRSALELARPVLDEELQTLCEGLCPPCEQGQVYDYSTLKEDEREWIETAEAALDAVDAALDSAPEPPHEAE
jgi:hypothetical protein